MWRRSFFGRSDRRRYSTIVVAAVCVAAVAFGLATTSNASVTAASGQYKPGLFIKSANVSKDGTQVTVSGTASCSPAASGDLGIFVSQETAPGVFAYATSGSVPGATCDIKTTSFSGTANIIPPPSGGPPLPLSKGPANVSVGYASLSTSVTINLK
jgi:hypothetical protein